MDKERGVGVLSDIAGLTKVIVHRPDAGIEWVTPTNKDFLLYDDIVYLPRMQEEHEILVETLKAFSGDSHVIQFLDLLSQLLDDESVKKRLLDAIVTLESLPTSNSLLLNNLSPVELASALVSGYKYHGEIILSPVVNLIFTRDIGAVINDHLLICHAEKQARKRENILTWFIAKYHPFFSAFQEDNKFIDLSPNEGDLVQNLKNGTFAIEGGDIIVLNQDNLIIACSERTNKHTIEAVRDILFRKNIVKKLTVIDIPKEEYCMHIDTIISQINTHDFVIYEKLLMDTDQIKVFQYVSDSDVVVHFKNVVEMLKAEDPEARFIFCGNGESPHDEREQWTMACNTVAVKPGVVISYRRNTRTVEALIAAGYSVVNAEDLLAAFRSGVKTPQETEMMVITILAGELSRGGGGPHCLTFPIER